MSTHHLSVRRTALIIASFAIGLLFLALPSFPPPGQVSYFFLFTGRLHPLILHFPIVLIILAFLFEVGSRYSLIKTGDNTVTALLIAAALSSVVSIGAGYFLFASGDYSGKLMENHLLAGALTGLAIFFTLGFFTLYRATKRYYYLYFGGLLAANALVAYTSHLGGSITHGQGYLTEHLQFAFHSLADDEPKSASDMLVYEDMVQPILEAKCVSCHNNQRAKGDFLLTSYEKTLRPGESDHPSVTPGNPSESELFKRVTLPEGHSDRMPPEGKTPLTDDEIALLGFWIAAGASDTLKVNGAKKIDTLERVISTLLPQLEKYRIRARVEMARHAELVAALERLATTLDVSIRPDSLSDDGLFALRMKFPPAPFTNDQFRELSPYFNVFSNASLISSGIDDAGLYYIGQMTNLRALYLQKTDLNGSGIIHLKNLPHLEVLNLSFTNVDDKALIDLLEFPSLREVYLYRTNTSMQVIEALRKYRPGVRFLLEEGPYF